MKKILSCLFLALTMVFSLTTVSAAYDVPERSSDKSWVEDYADVLSATTESHIQSMSQDLADKYSASITVVTVNIVNGDIAEYATAIFNKWQLGDSKLNNGILLLLSIVDDDYYMIIGRGLEDDLPISQVSYLLSNYLEDDFAAKRYDAGVLKVFDATYQYVDEEIYGGGYNNNGNNNPGSGITFYSFFITMISIIIMVIVLLSILRAITRPKRYYEPMNYYTRPRYRTYRSPYTYRPSHNVYSSPRSFPSSTYSSPSYHSSPSSSHSSGGSFSSGSGSSHGGSSRGAGAGRH